MKIKCIVAIVNQDGENDLYPVIVDLPEHEITNNKHLLMATVAAINDGNEPLFEGCCVYDEKDRCWQAFAALDWNNVKVVVDN